MDISKESKGLLTLVQIRFNKLNFKRSSNNSVQKSDISFNRHIIDIDNLTYSVSLSCNIMKENEFEIEIEIEGIFEVSEGISFKDLLIKNNATAIIFPYLRSQVTLLTAQPGMEPIVIPPININNIFTD